MSTRLLTCLASLAIATIGAMRGASPDSIVPLQSQDEESQEGEADDVNEGKSVFGRTKGRAEDIVDKLQGAWTLIHIEDPELPPEGRSHHGVMMVSGNFLAIEVHVAWDDEDGYELEDAFQSGIHEFAVDATGNLHSVSLIGSFLDEEAELDWEMPGTPRQFKVRLDRNFLTLTRSDGAALDFGRRLPRTGMTSDVFGRTDIKPVGSGDVFGRKDENQPKASAESDE
ncbi:MAG: hypothetical protein ACI835_003952 [Planctomycetota bacterium]|jgi:hypothetical protein